VFLIWPLINSIDTTGINNQFLQVAVAPLIGFISAFGFFSILASSIVYLLGKWRFLKKIIFSSTYFDGRWIGYYLSADGTPVVFFQIIEQSIDSIHITTEAYHLNKSYRCCWQSISEVSIDSRKSSFSYLYDVDVIYKNEISRGLFTAHYYKKGRIIKTPCRIHGHAFNLTAPKKMRTHQVKESDKITIDLKQDDINKLLEKAIMFYKSQNDFNVAYDLSLKEGFTISTPMTDNIKSPEDRLLEVD
jgi:hypothetical protein